MPITAFIGVRISWLIVARNELLASLAASAAARASCACLNRRAFWIAITAWSAKVLSSAISLSVNGFGGWRITSIEPMPLPFPQHRRVDHREVADAVQHALRAQPADRPSPTASGSGSRSRSLRTLGRHRLSQRPRERAARSHRVAAPRNAAERAASPSSSTRKMPSCSAGEQVLGSSPGSCRTPARGRPPSC